MLDGFAWGAALLLATLLRYDLHFEDVDMARVALAIPVACLAQYFCGYVTHLYRHRWVTGSFEEGAILARTVALATALLFGVSVLVPGRHVVPLSAVIGGGMVAFLMMGGARFGWRVQARRRRRPNGEAVRAIVFGAGEAGERAVNAMLNDPRSPYLPVAMLDDDPQKQYLSVRGIRVEGDRSLLPAVAANRDAKVVVIAVPSAGPRLVGELVDLADRAGVAVRVLPSVRELLDDDVRVIDIREPDEIEILGRSRIEIDLGPAKELLADRVIAVTGAGGSIGSELCRQISAFHPAVLLMIDRDESALQQVQMSLEGRALLDSPDLVLLDIRDRARVAELFAERRPDVVFHAAALKHLPLLEAYPAEALKTNVWGTRAVLDAAAASGVGCFVNISTDKAADPCSVLGYSKRVCERLTAHVAQETSRSYVSVRFGNVLRSRGSVLHAFQAQLEAGGPLTVTDPDVARYFMTVEEAVQLVVHAAAIGHGGDVLVLDMGEPIRIADVAARLAARSNPPVPIVFTGLRPGEKLNEDLLGGGELGRPTDHPLITCVDVPPLDPREVIDVDPTQPSTALIRCLRELSGRKDPRRTEHNGHGAVVLP
jgi:FlaA1/EpsC-like NDP-sugar epimerase